MTGGPWWSSWLDGYTQVRPFRDADRAAVPYFVLMHQLENTAWKLGLTPTSVGQLLDEHELGERVDDWLRWAETHCT
jgi:Ser/Thr protein kinase RdoA (MazF antagonist)